MTRRELLDAKLKRMANEIIQPFSNGSLMGREINAHFHAAHFDGSSSLAPMLLKLAEALEKYSHISLKNRCYREAYATRALAELDKFLEDK